MADIAPPHWQLDSIYPDIDSPEYLRDVAALDLALGETERYFDAHDVRGSGQAIAGDQGPALEGAIALIERDVTLLTCLRTYVNLRVATDAFDAAAQAQASALKPKDARFQALVARFKSWLRRLDLTAAASSSARVADHLYVLERNRQEADRLMSDDAESLAAALDGSGGSAWAKLYGELISKERIRASPLPDGEEGEYGVAELRTLQAHPDRAVRRKAYEAEIELLSRNQLSFAAAMNGVKGQVDTLARRRGWDSPFDYSLFQHGVSQQAVESMQEACRDSFPVVRSYLGAKAGLLGRTKLAWYDLFAPLPQAKPLRFTWDEAKAVVLERFGTYSDSLAAFAERTFEEGWIDVPPRKGKRNGAFCSAIHPRGESRVMLNFGGTLTDVFTLAHELGHAYHNDCKVRFGRTMLQVPTPMTLSETASIFCETIVFDGLVSTEDDAERLTVLEQNLQHAVQLLLDIHSRFLFESAVFAQRRERELSAEELRQAMLDAQAATYGDALANEERHPLMWAQKPHYYSSGLSFYNFPYTFGWLFGLGLYARYRADAEGFKQHYDELLASTGIASAADLAARFDIDIEDPAFWRQSLGVVEGRVAAFAELTAGRGS